MAGTTGTPKARALGAELREARERAGLGVRELARMLNVSHTVISRYESGQRSPKPEDVASILTAVGVNGDKRQTLIDLARDPDDARWLGVGMPELNRQLAALLDFEREAVSITDVSPLLVTGLLQTASYVRAIMTSAGVPRSEIETRVAVRVGRRDALQRREPAHLTALVGEFALQQLIGGPEVMAEQLAFLLKMAELPNVDLRVIPTRIGWHPGLEGPFVVVEFAKATPIAHLENRISGLFLHQKPDVDAYWKAADMVRQVAMSPDDSARLIAQEIDKLETM